MSQELHQPLRHASTDRRSHLRCLREVGAASVLWGTGTWQSS